MSPSIPLTEPNKDEYIVKIHFAKKKYPQSITLQSSIIWRSGGGGNRDKQILPKSSFSKTFYKNQV